jgi:hypothetical protein
MVDVVPDEQVISGHEADAVEIGQGPAGDRSMPDPPLDGSIRSGA